MITEVKKAIDKIYHKAWDTKWFKNKAMTYGVSAGISILLLRQLYFQGRADQIDQMYAIAKEAGPVALRYHTKDGIKKIVLTLEEEV